MSATFEVVASGFLATVQDLGRRGFQRQGVPVSGAMDPLSLQMGNLLVGNPRGAACVEIAMRGPVLRALADTMLAVTGADFGATLNRESLAPWRSVSVPAGAELAFGTARRGVWGYLCVAGGIDVPIVMGSRSTCLRAAFGGFSGRRLRPGDLLYAGAAGPAARPGRSLQSEAPRYSAHAVVRAVPGPQDDAFAAESLQTFFSSRYEVTPQADRMGYRLRGPSLAFRGSPDILSDAVTAGSVQVPADGQPIVLMADRQTTGGYAKIATVISADLPIVAQLACGERVSFARVSVEEAEEAAMRVEAMLAGLERSLG